MTLIRIMFGVIGVLTLLLVVQTIRLSISERNGRNLEERQIILEDEQRALEERNRQLEESNNNNQPYDPFFIQLLYNETNQEKESESEDVTNDIQEQGENESESEKNEPEDNGEPYTVNEGDEPEDQDQNHDDYSPETDDFH